MRTLKIYSFGRFQIRNTLLKDSKANLKHPILSTFLVYISKNMDIFSHSYSEMIIPTKISAEVRVGHGAC